MNEIETKKASDQKKEGEDVVGLARAMAQVLEEDANVGAVFGAPVKLDTRTVIPIARVSFGGGGGGVNAFGAAIDAVRGFLGRRRSNVAPSRTLAGGAGLGMDVRPIGFLAEEDGRVVFTRIESKGPRDQ